MRILKIDADAAKLAAKAIKILKSGGVIAYPTETFYALGVNAMDKKALKRLYMLKGRPSKKPLPIIVGDRKTLAPLLKKIPLAAERLMKKFWPGPLTIVFDAAHGLPELLTAKTGKIAVRIPKEKMAIYMAKKAGFPITSTSANPSGKIPARECKKVMEYFNGRIDIIIDGGKTPGGKPSTIVDVTGPIKILRKGAIPSNIVFDID